MKHNINLEIFTPSMCNFMKMKPDEDTILRKRGPILHACQCSIYWAWQWPACTWPALLLLRWKAADNKKHQLSPYFSNDKNDNRCLVFRCSCSWIKYNCEECIHTYTAERRDVLCCISLKTKRWLKGRGQGEWRPNASRLEVLRSFFHDLWHIRAIMILALLKPILPW